MSPDWNVLELLLFFRVPLLFEPLHSLYIFIIAARFTIRIFLFSYGFSRICSPARTSFWLSIIPCSCCPSILTYSLRLVPVSPSLTRNWCIEGAFLRWESSVSDCISSDEESGHSVQSDWSCVDWHMILWVIKHHQMTMTDHFRSPKGSFFLDWLIIVIASS